MHVIERNKMNFVILQKGQSMARAPGVRSMGYLAINNWDDYSFKTTFYLTFIDAHGTEHDLGDLKVGYVNQPHGWSVAEMSESFSALPDQFFSLGQSVEYYSKIRELPFKERKALLVALRDMVFDQTILSAVADERVFRDSLTRSVNYNSIAGQFKRVLEGGVELTEYKFTYRTLTTDTRAGFSLNFHVQPDKRPSRNLHVLIGRNGIGKTTLLNGMIEALVAPMRTVDTSGEFLDVSSFKPSVIEAGYFSHVVSVSFSAFDPFAPPPERLGKTDEIRYSYIGLKDVSNDTRKGSHVHKDIHGLRDDFVNSLAGCFGLTTKRERWLTAIQFLESDVNFAEMDLSRLTQSPQEELQERAGKLFTEKMSSGHAVVLLTITKLVERAEEKTLVIMDEPESHLHPPLLSAFTRAIADLLNKINGVAIIATHSPVVLQEVPRSCVWKLYRTRLVSESERPEIETFGENVGTLTREVFGLQVSKSGFHSLLQESVAEGKSYDQILLEYDEQLGLEARALLRALIANRGRQTGEI
ncbi:AAA family ATPase [Cupriavidus sp. CV2]|uniref:AAA family ATPase n=1 Tax=Cupriavidus ulmosensis TaxID=3065913 RepID=UPI00296B0F38|nr:AAA family ATPase [Cupriavidus sp. CV2]MDW3689197.1 AAA family ATPase [Cupriavidus sp. CV2]